MRRFAPLLGGIDNLIGFSKDALWLAGGTKGRDTLESALLDKTGQASIFHFEMNTRNLAELVESEAARLDDVHAIQTDDHPGRLRLALTVDTGPCLRGSVALHLLGLGARLVNFQAGFQGHPAER